MNQERTVPETVEEYLTHLRARVARGTYSATCLEDMERVLRKFAKQFAIPVSQCRRGDLMYFLDANPQFQSIHTKKRVCTSIVSCFRWALEEELIGRCPYRRPKELMRGAYPGRRPMKLNEFRAMLRKSNPSFRRALIGLFRTQGYTTLRSSFSDIRHGMDGQKNLRNLRAVVTASTGDG